MMRVFSFICFNLILVLLFGCSGVKSIPTSSVSQVSASGSAKQNTMVEVNFTNDRGQVRVQIDPNDEDVYIDFKSKKQMDTIVKKPSTLETNSELLVNGLNKSNSNSKFKTDTIVKVDTLKMDSLLWKNLKGIEAKEAQKAFTLIQSAQEKFYKKDYNASKELLTQSLEILPTPDAYALMGTVLYVTQNRMAAKYYWGKSLELNPNQPKVRKALDGIGDR